MGWRWHLAPREFYHPQPMNLLLVGTADKTDLILEHLPSSYLLIDDGTTIDALTLPPRRKVTYFDVAKHSFNPVQGINHLGARELATTIYALSPQGDGTLTVRNGKRALARLLLDNTSLDQITGNRKDPVIAEALSAIDDLLFSPVLKNVLCKPTNLSLKGIILARLNRAELGDDDCFILGNLLISKYKGQIIVPDFGFYGAKHHSSLIRQERLIAGINFLDEAPKLKNQLLLIENKIPKHCTTDDAEILFSYTGKKKDSIDHSDFITDSIR